MKVNKTIYDTVEADSKEINDMIDKVVLDASDSMTAYIESIRTFLEKGVEDVTLEDLNAMALRVNVLLYFLSSRIEKTALKASVADIVKQEHYSRAYNAETNTGTIADKTSRATDAVKEEEVIRLIFDKAYKILKAKYESANKLCDTLRKLISSRISEMELTKRS